MVHRVLTLVVMVLLLALPHVAGQSSGDALLVDHAAAHTHPVAPDLKDTGSSHRSGLHDGLTCITICTGTPLVEAFASVAPESEAVPLWAGFGGPLAGALASPATLSRPPDFTVAA